MRNIQYRYHFINNSNSTAMELVSSRNIDELVFVLKQEITKTHNTAEHDDTGKYRQLLVRTLHTCSIKVSSEYHSCVIVYVWVRVFFMKYVMLHLILNSFLELQRMLYQFLLNSCLIPMS